MNLTQAVGTSLIWQGSLKTAKRQIAPILLPLFDGGEASYFQNVLTFGSRLRYDVLAMSGKGQTSPWYYATTEYPKAPMIVEILAGRASFLLQRRHEVYHTELRDGFWLLPPDFWVSIVNPDVDGMVLGILTADATRHDMFLSPAYRFLGEESWQKVQPEVSDVEIRGTFPGMGLPLEGPLYSLWQTGTTFDLLWDAESYKRQWEAYWL